MATKVDIGLVLAKNLQKLMERRELSQAALGRASGIGQRTISTIVDTANPADSNPTIRTVDAIGRTLGLQAWQMLQPEQQAESSPTSLDVALLTSAIRIAAEVFREARRNPSDDQLAAAATFLYQHVQSGARIKAAATEMKKLLAKVGSGELVLGQ